MIYTTRMQRVAFYDPFDRQYDSSNRTMLMYCIYGVVGTGRIKTALMTQYRAEQKLVATNQPGKNCFHYMCMASFSFDLLLI